jgi:hemin uptake protein HemP
MDIKKKPVAVEPGRLEPIAVARRIGSELLFGASREVLIVHGTREYRLRLTQNGKLILTA